MVVLMLSWPAAYCNGNGSVCCPASVKEVCRSRNVHGSKHQFVSVTTHLPLEESLSTCEPVPDLVLLRTSKITSCSELLEQIALKSLLS